MTDIVKFFVPFLVKIANDFIYKILEVKNVVQDPYSIENNPAVCLRKLSRIENCVVI